MSMPQPSGASFRMKSRQISNCAPDIKDFTLETLALYSPKAVKTLEIINEREGQNGLYYSQFKQYGSDIIAKALEVNYGWNRVYNMKTAKSSGKGYSIISGDIDTLVRTEIVNIYNSPANHHGEIIRLLLITDSGSEGLDLHNIRYVIIEEPFFNMARINQVIARAVRYNSHMELTPGERNVQTYILLAIKPGKLKEDASAELSTDETLWQKSLLNMEKINYFFDILKQSSIDCEFNYKQDCHVCLPTDQPLYSRNMLKDLELPSPCQPYQESEVSAFEILVDNQPYSYMFDDPKKPSIFNLHIYKFDKLINSYVEVGSDNPSYSQIVEALEESGVLK